MDIVYFFLFVATCVAMASIAMIVFVVYKWRTGDVISIDNIKDPDDFEILKELASDPDALKKVGREYAAGVYGDID